MVLGQYCSACGAAFSTEARYCGKCGTPRPMSGTPASAASPAAVGAGGPVAAPGSTGMGPLQPGAAPSGTASYGVAGSYVSQPQAAPAALQPPPPVDLTKLADMGTRTGAFFLNIGLGLPGLIPGIGQVYSLGLWVFTLVLYAQGQDPAAKILKLRIVRGNGDVAGWFQTAVRYMASIISFIVVGAGFWTAYSHPQRRTWHDIMLDTYVLVDSPELASRPRTSSTGAVTAFWIVVGVAIALAVLVTALVVVAFANADFSS